MAPAVQATPPLLPFPRSVRTYVGRHAELERVLGLIDREPMVFVYGVGGIGKSEFVYRVVEHLLDDTGKASRWQTFPPVLLQMRAGAGVAHLVAQLQSSLGLTRTLDAMGPRPGAGLDGAVTEILAVLEARPRLVFIDDAHHLSPDELMPVLGRMSRHLTASRLFLASRRELPLPHDMPVPVILRLESLGAEEAVTLAAALAQRLGVSVPDGEDIVVRSGGSPFYIQRLVAGDEAGQVESALDRTLRDLDGPLRQLLLAIAALRGRFSLADIVAALAEIPAQSVSAFGGASEGEIEARIRELGHRFLTDISREAVTVHDLVRDALARQEGFGESASAHCVAARVCRYRFESGPDGDGDPLDAIEAIYHLLEAREHGQAWCYAVSNYTAIASAGLDHLLLESLGHMTPALSRESADIDLLRARIAIRRSLVAEAESIIDNLAAAPVARGFRYVLTAGEVAQRQGRLDRAAALFRQAEERAESKSEHWHAALQLAYVLCLRGHNAQARATIEAGIHRLGAAASVRDRGRARWMEAVSYVIEECFEEGRDVAVRGAEELAGSGAEDLIAMLAMLEVLTRTECGDVAGARAVFDRVLETAVDAGTLREPFVAFYRGVVLYGEGDMVAARSVLADSFAHLRENTEYVTASIAAYYLERTMVALGQSEAAMAISEELIEMARRAGLDSLLANGLAARADALLANGRVREAHAQAQAVLDDPSTRSNARWLAHMVRIRGYALEGEMEQARSLCESAAAGISVDKRYRRDAELERATIEIMGGDADYAVTLAASALEWYRAQGRRWLEAQAGLALCAALIERGRSTDIPVAQEPLARVEELGREGQFPLVRAGAALVRAALMIRAGERDGAIVHIEDIARAISARGESPEVAILRAGLEGAQAAVAPGLKAFAAALGITTAERYRLIDRDGERIIGEREVDEVRQQRTLVVEPARAAITVQSGGSDSGRPTMCELLARLIEGRGVPVAAEALFRDVWHGRDYHPLRHRNTVYVALKRLRQALRKLLGDRTVIETVSGGWRICDDIDAVSIRPLSNDDGRHAVS